MGLIRNAVVILISLYLAYVVKQLTDDVPVVIPPKNAYWGPGPPKPDDTAIYPFKVNVPNEVILDLNNRLDIFLRRAKTPPLENTAFQYGTNSAFLKRFVEYWRYEYHWNATQVYLNKYSHFTTEINGLKIHFLKIEPANNGLKQQVLPLLLLHGWPNTFRDFFDMVPLLTSPDSNADYVFELIIPSIPGFAFSQGSSKTMFGPAEMAVVLNNLMERLGYDKYYVHGGDWSAALSRLLGVLYPDRVLGVHSTMCMVSSKLALLATALGSLYPPLVIDSKHEHHVYPMMRNIKFLMGESGYFIMQATKPDTIGALLDDSPAGMAAWFIDKFITGTNRSYLSLADGGLTRHFKWDTLLDTIMIYWLTNSGTTAARLYAEGCEMRQLKLYEAMLTTPAACARFPNEMVYFPDTILRLQYSNLVYSSDLPEGGHFSALEKPKLLANDIWAAVGKIEETRIN